MKKFLKVRLSKSVPVWAWAGITLTPLALIINFALIVLNDSAKGMAAADLVSSASKSGFTGLTDPESTITTAFNGGISSSLLYAPMIAVGVFNILLMVAIHIKSMRDAAASEREQ